MAQSVLSSIHCVFMQNTLIKNESVLDVYFTTFSFHALLTMHWPLVYQWLLQSVLIQGISRGHRIKFTN